MWKRLFAHIFDKQVTEEEIIRIKLTQEQVNDIKFYNFFQRISTSGKWGNESVLDLFVMKFEVDVCVFIQGNDIKK